MPDGHAFARTMYCGTPSGRTLPGTRGCSGRTSPGVWAGDGWLLNRGAQPSRGPIRPPIRVIPAPAPRSGARDDVHRALLRSLAGHRGVRERLDVVAGAVGPGVAERSGVLVLVQLGEGAGGVLGRAHVGRVLGDLLLQPLAQRLALGLLEGRRPEAHRLVVLPVAGLGGELRVLVALHGREVVLGDVRHAVVLGEDVAGGLALGAAGRPGVGEGLVPRAGEAALVVGELGVVQCGVAGGLVGLGHGVASVLRAYG